jgi:hypothetical protein
MKLPGPTGVLAAALLVRGGQDQASPPVFDQELGRLVKTHTPFAVHTEMLRQICRDYPGLPDPRVLKWHEIRFFYDGIRAELRELTKSK